jgi:hypothetical protein
VLLGKVFASALRVGSTVVLVLAFGFMAYACYRRYLDTGSVNMLGLVVINTIFMAMFMARRAANDWRIRAELRRAIMGALTSREATR